ncbi:MAG: DUF1993 domain-containing protein [Marinicaulis sp.]|nr:DUF1993 domain-containing protein [Marinicaulis sp.]
MTMSKIARRGIDQMLNALEGVLDKGEKYAKENDIDAAVVTNWRLAPDMLPLTSQVQIATEIAARGLARLARGDIPSFDDLEPSFDAYRARIADVRKIMDGLPADAIDADPDDMVDVPMGDREMTLPRIIFLQNFVLPNVYFHVTAAYLILRNIGVPLGKRDFMAMPN